MKKRMKTALAAVLLAAMTLTMTACGNSQEKTYEKATKLLNDGKYAEAAEKFESLGSYEDASQMTMYAKAINEAENGNFEVAFKAFAALGDYKDCAQLQAYYVAREYEDNERYEEAIEAYNANPLFRDSQSRIEQCKETLYKTAISEAENGNFRYAFEVFTALGDYKDSAQMYAYYVAREYEYNEEYEKAIEAYGKDLTFKDSQERAERCQETLYETGISEAENGNFEYALDAFEALGDYKDCVQLKAYYVAREYEYKGMYREAFAAYDKDPTFKDSQERAEQCREKLYKAAINKAEIGSFEYAYKAFNALGDYKDCIQLKAYYVAREYEYNEEYEKAITAYGKDLTFKDSQERAEQCREKLYETGISEAENGNFEYAFEAFNALRDYKDCVQLKAYYVAREYEYNKEYEKAIEAYGKDLTFKDSQSRVEQCKKGLYINAIDEAENGNFEEALRIFVVLGDYKDSVQLHAYYVAREYEYNEEYEKAIEAYSENLTFKDSQDRVERCGVKLLEEELLTAFDGATGVIIDTTGKKVVPCQYDYDYVGGFSEGLARVEKDEKYGYIDTTGTEVIPCQYDYTEGFSEGLARVEKDEKYGYIDTTGTEVIPCQYYYAASFSEGFACVKKGGKYGYIDTTGTEVVPCQYDDVKVFSEGLACVEMDEKWGYVDTTGTEVIPCQYYDAASFSEGLAAVEKEKGGYWVYVDTTGTEVIPCHYYGVWSFSEGLARVVKDGNLGYIDTKGTEVIPCQYYDAGSFSEGLARVEKDGKWGYIDTTGKVVIPCQYDDASDFSEGLARVEKDGKYGYIDITGKKVIPCQYDNVWGFSEGLACVEKDGKYGYIDITGKKVIPCQYDDVNVFSEGLARVEKDGKYGYIDTMGKVVIPFVFSYACDFGDGLAYVEIGK